MKLCSLDAGGLWNRTAGTVVSSYLNTSCLLSRVVATVVSLWKSNCGSTTTNSSSTFSGTRLAIVTAWPFRLNFTSLGRCRVMILMISALMDFASSTYTGAEATWPLIMFFHVDRDLAEIFQHFYSARWWHDQLSSILALPYLLICACRHRWEPHKSLTLI